MKKYPSIILSVVMGAVFGIALTYAFNTFATSSLTSTGLLSDWGAVFNDAGSNKVIIDNLGGIKMSGDAPVLEFKDTDIGGRTYKFINSAISNGNFGLWDASASNYRIYVKSDGNVGIGTNSPSAKLSVGDHIYINEEQRTGIFNFICTNNASWTAPEYCGWVYADSDGNHCINGCYGCGKPGYCSSPFTQPGSGPSVANMQTIINNMLPRIATNYFYSKVFVTAVSGINSWTGINFCGGGGTDGNQG